MPRTMLQGIAKFALTVATLTACDTEPTALQDDALVRASALTPANNTISRDEGTVPFSFVVYTPCANCGQGEVLQVSGQMTYRGHWITTSNGQRNHVAFVARFIGTGTGWETGEMYDVATRERAQSNIDYGDDGIPDSGEEMQRVQLRLTSRATGAVTDIVIYGRFVQTATGEFVVDSWDGTARCF